MARLTYLNAADLTEPNRDLLARPINLARILVHSPGLARRFVGLGEYIRYDSRLDPRLRELAILQAGWSAHAPYEWSHHVKLAMDVGVSEADIRAIAAESRGEVTALDATARLVLRAAREATLEPCVSAPTFEALAATLDAERLVDLMATIAFYTGVVKLLASLAVDVEPDYQPYLDRFPLP